MHIAFPSVVLKNGIGVEMDEGLNLAGLVNSVNESVANVTYAGKVGVCAIGTLLNPASALNVITSVFDSIASVAADVMETITDAIAGQIEAILYDTIGSVFTVLEAVLSLLQSIVSIFNTIGKIVSQFTKIGELNLKDLYDQQACEGILASIAACYLNKLIGPKIDEFEEEALRSVREVGSDLHERIAKNFDDIDEVRYYMNQETKMLNKANTQLKGLTNLF